jgi:hypothetical protein
MRFRSSPRISSTIRPSCIITVRVPASRACSRLWVIMMAVSCCSLTIRQVRSMTISAVRGSSDAICSSSRSSCGFLRVAIRRVKAWRCPPERSPTLVVRRSSSPNPSVASCSRKKERSWKRIAFLSLRRWPRLHAITRFSSTVIRGAVPVNGF